MSIPNRTLSNGIKIPEIGFGTWQIEDGKAVVEAIKTAVKKGYRHIDTAAAYGNETGIGKAIRELDIPREEIFLTSKVWNNNRGKDKVLRAFEESIKKFGLDYLDLYLVHWPAGTHRYADWEQLNASTWQAMEQLYKEGKVKSIGVSNFRKHHFEALLKTAEIIPMVNQMEIHPGFAQLEQLDYCKQHDVVVQAWSPFGAGRVLENDLLKAIAAKHKKSTAQICLRWCLQHETVPLPKSSNEARMQANLDVYDFELTPEEMQRIDQMPETGFSGQDPDSISF